MISSLKPRQSCCPFTPRTIEGHRPRTRVENPHECSKRCGLPRLRLNWGRPVRPARRVLPLDVRHRALLVDRGREASCTLTADDDAVNRGKPVVRTARTCAIFRHACRRGMRLYISIRIGVREELSRDNRSNAVYLRRGLLFDSKIKQLRNMDALAAATARRTRCLSRPESGSARARHIAGEDRRMRG